MSIEPHIKGETIWAGIKGASSSTAALFIIQVIALVLTTPAESDGVSLGFLIIAVFLPLIWSVLFVYYLFLSIKKCRQFKFALLVQTIISLIVAMFIFFDALGSSNIGTALVIAIFVFGIFSVVGAAGAWVWSKSKST